LKIFGEIAGFLAVAVGFFIFQQKDRKRILMFKLICDVLWTTHFALLGALSGMAISGVGILREIVFSKVRKEDNRKSNLWLLLFLSVNTISVLLLWNTPWSVCSLISSILSTIAFWQKSASRIKVISLGVCISQITYAIAMGSYAACLNELIVISSILIFFIRNSRRKFAKASSEDEKCGGKI